MSTNPSDTAGEVARDATITVTFDKEVKPATVTAETFIVMDGLNNAVQGTITCTGNTATFTPESRLAVHRAYTVTVKSGVTDNSGMPMRNDYVFRFITKDGAWDAPERIDDPAEGDYDILWPRMDADPVGNTIVAWIHGSGGGGKAYANRYTDGIGWDVAVNFGSADETQIACGPSGNAIMVWSTDQGDPGYNTIFYSIYDAAAGWSAPGIFATGYLCRVHCMAFDPAGNAIIVYDMGDDLQPGTRARWYMSGSGWGSDELIETESAGSARIAFDHAGNAILLYVMDHSLWANRYTAGSGWGAAELIESDDTMSAGNPQLALDAAGNAIAVWQQSDGVQNSLWANRYTAGSGWGTAETIEGNTVDAISDHQIAVDAMGNAIAVWQRFDGTQNDIRINRYTAGSGWGSADLVQANAQCPRLGCDPAGNAILVWLDSPSTPHNLWARRYLADSGWGSPQLLAHNDDEYVGAPLLVVNPSGTAIATWKTPPHIFRDYLYAAVFE